MTFSPTSEQTAIISAVTDGNANLLIEALAGAAKTSTLLLIAEALPRTPILAVAFNKKISTEMQARLPSNCKAQTLNSLGHRAWGDYLLARGVRRLTLSTNKLGDLFREAVSPLPQKEQSALWDSYRDIMDTLRFAKAAGHLPDAFTSRKEWAASPILTDDDLISASDTLYSRDTWDFILSILTRSAELATLGTIDFDDQILFPAFYRVSFPSYPLILVDEAQDLSPLNHLLLVKLAKTRIIAVGDTCQPDGTLISVVLQKGDRWNAPVVKQIPIEDVRIGDTVLGHNNNGSFLYNRKVEGITRRPYEGRLVEVCCDGNISAYTPEHICLVNHKPLEEKYVLYLMRRGDNFRLGKAKFGYDGGCGPVMRARAETADAVWLLTTGGAEEVALEEAWAQAHFGIPDLTFISPESNVGGFASQPFLNAFWGRMEFTNLTKRAASCLTHYGREMAYPFWEEDKFDDRRRASVMARRPMLIRACNLLEGAAMLPYKGDKLTGRESWKPITVGTRHYSGFVTSFTISDNHLYVADNLVTHNCQAIYAFRGASETSMSELRRMFKMETLHLTTTFRCASSIVEHVRWRAPLIQAWPSNPHSPGSIRYLPSWSPEDVSSGDAILCRNNAPLLATAVHLLRHGKYPKLWGNDIASGLLKTMEKLGPGNTTSSSAHHLLTAWGEEQEAKLRSRSAKASLADRISCIRIFLDSAPTLGEAIAFGKTIFSLQGPIDLATVHKAKGSEWTNVFILNQSLFGDEGQELNLRYVAATRAKASLTYITTDGRD